MSDLQGHRTEDYRVELLTRTEDSLGELDGVLGGELKWNANARLHGGGSIDLLDLGQDINFSSDRVRIWYRCQEQRLIKRPDEYTEWAETRRNLAIRPIVGSGWTVTAGTQAGGAAATANGVTHVPATGAPYYLVTWTTAATGGNRRVTAGFPSDVGSIVPGKTYTFSVDVWSPTGAPMRIAVDWQNAAGTYLSQVASTSATPGTSIGTATRIHVTGVAPANASRVAVYVWNSRTSIPVNDQIAARSLLIEEGTRTDYFDGNTPTTDTSRARWQSTVNASQAILETRQVTSYPPEIVYEPVEWPMGVFVLAAPSTQYGATGRTRSIALIDKITVLADDLLLQTLQIPAGANVVQAAVDQIYAAGEERVAVTASDKVLSNAMTWAPGESRLTVINDLLAAAGYWSLWADRNGLFRVEPYTSPADRPITWEFQEGETSLHSPDWEHELSLWDATNTVLLVSQEDDDDQVWTAYAVDDNPDSPTSTVSMGRVLNPIVEENVEATSQADLQAQANRILYDNSNVAGKLSVEHAMLPLWFREGVLFTSQGMSTKATITSMSIRLQPGALVRAEWSQA